MGKLIEEFRRGWQGTAPPSLGLSIAFAAACLLVATLTRWALAHVRPDVYFTPYFPAVFFAALALLDANGHACRVDIADSQMQDLIQPQPGRIGRHQHRPLLLGGGVRDELLYFLATQEGG